MVNICVQEVVFGPGESQKEILIEIINDALPEPDERFEVVLSNPKNGAALGQFVRGGYEIIKSVETVCFRSAYPFYRHTHTCSHACKRVPMHSYTSAAL